MKAISHVFLALMCTAEDLDSKDFTDDFVQEKYQNLKFVQTNPKEFIKLCKSSPLTSPYSLSKTHKLGYYPRSQ